ncbi:MAG: glucose/arabinose dehydrogenase/mono/diheme cytochrome c family protein, partial [Rhodothermales bacterium]
ADQLGFPGADAFYGPYADGNTANGVGHFETDEQWLSRLQPDTILAFFGFNEAFLGPGHLANYRAELDAFLKHTLSTKYDGKAAPQVALISPIAFEDRSADMDVPNGKRQNRSLAAYTGAMQEVAAANGVLFVDVFNPSIEWYRSNENPLTANGAQMNDAGYKALSWYLIDKLYGLNPALSAANVPRVQESVTEKNWFWINDFKMPNGVHVFGRRFKPFGPANYPDEITKIREMTAIRDQAIWATLQGKKVDVAALDAKTHTLPAVRTNYRPGGKNGALTFFKGDEALSKLKVPEGYKIEQFASEQEFPDLANPVQLAFDNKGRLWVATMPSYPHYLPGGPRPDDKLIILEDTDNDGKADKQTTFADKLHLPMGFEFAPEGVYVSQGVNLVLLSDANGDDKADGYEVIFSGFDDHDTHHAIGAYCADPSGALIMCEGVFLRTSVETPYGTVRGTDGGFYRYSPQRRRLERHAQLSIPNPWGVAFDDWGQHFFLHTSGTRVEWMLPSSIKPRYGVNNPNSIDLIDGSARVRPTSGIEFLHSSHFPDEVQGDMLLCNAIGFLGTKQHKMNEDGTGYNTKPRHDLVKAEGDGNFRPVDLEIAPDGSLYIVDWHNPLIGHMQHNARDPHRDHAHGRIYRVTYPSRPLVKPAHVAGAPIPVLLDNLKLPEYRTRYRTRRELRGRNADDVLAALKPWVAGLNKSDARYDHHVVEALWVTWGLNKIDPELVNQVLASKDHRARAAAVRVLRYARNQVPDRIALLKKAAADPHGRVKMEAIAAASWAGQKAGLAILDAVVENSAAPEEEGLAPSPEAKVIYKGHRITIADPKIAKADITRIELAVPGKGQTINLTELEVFTGKKNVANTAKISMSSIYGGKQFPGKLLVDGNKTTDNFAHTDAEDNPWIKADFTKAVNVDKVTITNRKNYEDRFNGGTVTFFEGDKRIASVKLKIAGSSKASGAGDSRVTDIWLSKPFATALAHLNGETIVEEPEATYTTTLKGAAKKSFEHGAEIFMKEGYCGTCHQLDGKGLPAAGFPPLDSSKWVTQDVDRLIKLTLNGLHGPIEVKGKPYPGLVPMTPFAGLLNDREIADVLTFVRNTFGNKGSVVAPADVARVRAATKSKVGFYNPAELLKQHPHK